MCLVADDHPVVRAGLGAVIAEQDDLELVAEAENGANAVALFREHRPDVALMDLRMPVMDGVEAIRAITTEFPDARILALTTYEGDADIRRALEAGASGYLLKDMLLTEVLTAVRAVHRGERVIPIAVAARLEEFPERSDLTERETEVLQLVARGLSNKEVARAIGRTDETVKIHLKNAFAKLAVADRTEAVTVALTRGPHPPRLTAFPRPCQGPSMPQGLDHRSAPVRYGFAILTVAAATLVTLAARHFGLANRSAAFLAAILLTSWYAGNGPMLVAMVLSTFVFDYFFLPPLYTLGVSLSPDPYLVWFLLFAILAAWFSAARRRSAALLEQARSELESRVAARTADLRRSEAYLVNGQELSHVGSYARRAATGEGYWSDETYRIFGLDPRAPAPTLEQMRQIVHPDDRDPFDQALAAAMSGATRLRAGLSNHPARRLDPVRAQQGPARARRGRRGGRDHGRHHGRDRSEARGTRPETGAGANARSQVRRDARRADSAGARDPRYPAPGLHRRRAEAGGRREPGDRSARDRGRSCARSSPWRRRRWRMPAAPCGTCGHRRSRPESSLAALRTAVAEGTQGHGPLAGRTRWKVSPARWIRRSRPSCSGWSRRRSPTWSNTRPPGRCACAASSGRASCASPSPTTAKGSPSTPTSAPTVATGDCSACGSAPARSAPRSRCGAVQVRARASRCWSPTTPGADRIRGPVIDA